MSIEKEILDYYGSKSEKDRLSDQSAFFHLPDELLSEAMDAGFQNAQLYAIESFGDNIPNLPDKWQNEAFQIILLETLRKVESDPAIIGMSPHIMAVGKKGTRDWHC